MDFLEIAQAVFMAATTAVIGYFVWVRKEIRSESRETKRSAQSSEELTRLAMVALLRAKMWTIYSDAQEHDGKITQTDRDHFCDLYDVYTKMGGNGRTSRLNEAVRNMPDRH